MQGENCSEVLRHYHDDQRLWGLVRRVKLLRYKQLSPFSKTIIGVSTRHPYEIRIRVWSKFIYVTYFLLNSFVNIIDMFADHEKLIIDPNFWKLIFAKLCL